MVFAAEAAAGRRPGIGVGAQFGDLGGARSSASRAATRFFKGASAS
jgi:hypothetical protein